MVIGWLVLVGTVVTPPAEGTAKIVLLSPPEEAVLCLSDAAAERVTFSWRGVAGPYRLQVASDSDFKRIVREDQDLTDNAAEVRALKAGRYAWRVGVGKKPSFSSASWFRIVDRCTSPR